MADTTPTRGASKPPAGERFGRYILLEKLGQTALIETYRARVDGPQGFEKTCALDRLLQGQSADQETVDAFVDRARLASRLHHPNLVEVHDFLQVDGHHVVAREYVDGATLGAYLDACGARGATPPVGLALYVAGELCRALAYLRGLTAPDGSPQPVTHGNLVPASILMGRHGVVKLTDFRVGASTGEVSPESDLRDVARLCHAMLLGRMPTDQEEESLSDVPPGLAVVLRRARAGQLDPDALQDGLLDYSFDAGVRVTDRALIEALQTHDGVVDAPPPPPSTRPLGAPRPKPGESTYRIQSGAGSELGTIPRSNLASLLLNDAIASTALVSVDGGDWQPLDGLPIYAETPRALSSPPVPILSAGLDAQSLAEMGARIGITRLTGCMRVQDGEALKQFWFRRGVPIRSTSTLSDELLGPCMVRSGLIDEAALQAARAVMAAEGGLFGEVLLNHRLCSAGALHRGLEVQLAQRFYQLLDWSRGHLTFLEDQAPGGETMRMSQDAVQLVTGLVRERYDADRLFGLLQSHLDATISIDTQGPITHDNLRLNGRELRQLSQLTEGLSLREQLLPLAGQTDTRTTFLRVVFLLHAANVLSFDLPTVKQGRRR